MPRYVRSATKDLEFHVHTNADGTWSHEAIHSVVLMDIRDELKRLNRLLSCPNFRGIPNTLLGIRRNTHKPKRKRKAAAPK